MKRIENIFRNVFVDYDELVSININDRDEHMDVAITYSKSLYNQCVFSILHNRIVKIVGVATIYQIEDINRLLSEIEQ